MFHQNFTWDTLLQQWRLVVSDPGYDWHIQRYLPKYVGETPEERNLRFKLNYAQMQVVLIRQMLKESNDEVTI